MNRQRLSTLKSQWSNPIPSDYIASAPTDILSLIGELEKAWALIASIDMTLAPAIETLQSYRRSFQ